MYEDLTCAIYVIVNKLQYDMFQSHTDKLDILNGMNMSLPLPCFSVLKMYIQRLNYQVFPMKTSEAFQIWTKCVENKWERNRVPLGERKLDCTLTKEPQK